MCMMQLLYQLGTIDLQPTGVPNPPELLPFSTGGSNSMLKLLAFLFVCAAFVTDTSAQRQILILDRPPAESFQSLGLTNRTDAFIADDFVVGVVKEDWI